MIEERAIERLRTGFLTARGGGGPRTACPDPEEIWEAVHGRLAVGPARRLGTHAIECAACRGDWRLAVEFRAASLEEGLDQQPAGERSAPRATASWRLWWGLAAAAMIVAVVGVALHLREPSGPAPAPSYRDLVEEPIRSEIGDALPREAFVLRWSAPEGARFNLRVATGDLQILATASELEANEYRVPEAVLAVLPDGARVVWQVEAVFPDGRRLTSRSFTARVE